MRLRIADDHHARRAGRLHGRDRDDGRGRRNTGTGQDHGSGCCRWRRRHSAWAQRLHLGEVDCHVGAAGSTIEPVHPRVVHRQRSDEQRADDARSNGARRPVGVAWPFEPLAQRPFPDRCLDVDVRELRHHDGQRHRHDELGPRTDVGATEHRDRPAPQIHTVRPLAEGDEGRRGEEGAGHQGGRVHHCRNDHEGEDRHHCQLPAVDRPIGEVRGGERVDEHGGRREAGDVQHDAGATRCG